MIHYKLNTKLDYYAFKTGMETEKTLHKKLQKAFLEIDECLIAPNIQIPLKYSS